MINTILAVDNDDSELGSFFAECLQDIENFENEAKSLDIVKSNALNDLTISLKLSNISKIIFLAFSHGGDDSLVVKGSNPYISCHLNIDKFSGSLFYACACDTGKVLGQTLIDNGCASFIGYNDKFTVWAYNTQPFVECANLGYKLFLQGYNIKEIIDMMRAKYDEHIDNYNNDFFGAAILLANKNVLTVKGNLGFTINDLV